MEPTSIFDYFTDEQIERLRERKRAVQVAQDEVTRIAEAVRDVERSLGGLSAIAHEDAANEAARYLGEEPLRGEPLHQPVLQAKNRPTKATLKGLQNRHRQAEITLATVESQYAVEEEAAVAGAMRRAQSVFLDAVRVVTSHHAMFSSAQVYIDNLNIRRGRPQNTMLNSGFWSRLHIPGSDCPGLPEISKASIAIWGAPTLYDGKHAEEQGAGMAALRRFQEAMRREVESPAVLVSPEVAPSARRK